MKLQKQRSRSSLGIRRESKGEQNDKKTQIGGDLGKKTLESGEGVFFIM